MDIILVLFGFLFMIIGILGSFLPVLPGPPLSWVGLLLLFLTKAVEKNSSFLIITLVIALAAVVLDYVIPAVGTKRFGGSRLGVIGTTVGLFVGLFSPIPFGIIIGPFVGALIGELMNNADRKKAVKAAFGSFLGFLTGTFLKFLISIIYLGYFLNILWNHKSQIFW